MENLSHTLLGLGLAKAGLERATPLATTTLVISSNLPDIDALTAIWSDTLSYLEHHRGFTHSFIGLALLAGLLTLALVYLNRRFRLRRDLFRRPVRPMRIFWLALLGGLGHLFMDFTNNYGVRPLLPFSNRWFYGDTIFVADPWIWLILGSAVVWLTAKDGLRIVFWLVLAVAASLVVALAFRQPQYGMAAIPVSARVVWFVGLAIIIAGSVLGWGRAGNRLARYSLLFLGVYYAGMWLAHQSALQQARQNPPVENSYTLAAWPVPAYPPAWGSVAVTDTLVYSGEVDLIQKNTRWREAPRIEPRFLEALRQSNDTRRFLNFARFTSATVEETDAGYTLLLRDLRFPLQMNVTLDRDLTVLSTSARWY